MKIAVNTRFLLSNKLEGIGWFTFEVFKRLCQRHKDIEWIFIFDRPFDPSFVFGDNVTPVVAPPPARHPVLWYIWFEWSVPRVLKKYKADIFISPDGYVSLKNNVPDIAIIHDINFEHHPENLAGRERSYFLRNFRKFANKATRVATVSNYSKEDIAETYGVKRDKIDVVYNGCGDFFFPIPGAKQAEVKDRLAGGAEYFLFIGALNPRKNLHGMLKAYELYRQNGGHCKFVVVGERMLWTREIENAYHGNSFKEDIIFMGRQEGKGLNEILASSHALLFVSHFEGFGIPIVEAFKCKVPVITSSTTSMPEVAGDAALICDPDDTDGIERAMHKISDKDLRDVLIQKGEERAAQFTWDRSADMMWDSIQKVISSKINKTKESKEKRR